MYKRWWLLLEQVGGFSEDTQLPNEIGGKGAGWGGRQALAKIPLTFLCVTMGSFGD